MAILILYVVHVGLPLVCSTKLLRCPCAITCALGYGISNQIGEKLTRQTIESLPDRNIIFEVQIYELPGFCFESESPQAANLAH